MVGWRLLGDLPAGCARSRDRFDDSESSSTFTTTVLNYKIQGDDQMVDMWGHPYQLFEYAVPSSKTIERSLVAYVRRGSLKLPGVRTVALIVRIPVCIYFTSVQYILTETWKRQQVHSPVHATSSLVFSLIYKHTLGKVLKI